MGDELILEAKVLQQEYESLLQSEVNEVLTNLHSLLSDASKSLNFGFNSEQEVQIVPEKFLLSSQNINQQVKCMVTLVGDIISEADVALKLQKQQMVHYQTRIYPEVPWKLQQIQDARNQILLAICVIESVKESSTSFKTGLQVINILESISNNLRLGREYLTIPKRKTLEEIVKNPSIKAFKPALPQDAAVSFYIQGNKLILSVYHLFTNQMNRVDIASRYQVECVVPWLNELLLLFKIASQNCQQLQDKIYLLMNFVNEVQISSSVNVSEEIIKCSNFDNKLLIEESSSSAIDKQISQQRSSSSSSTSTSNDDTIQTNHLKPRPEVGCI